MVTRNHGKKLVSNLGDKGRVATKTGAGENHKAEKGKKTKKWRENLHFRE